MLGSLDSDTTCQRTGLQYVDAAFGDVELPDARFKRLLRDGLTEDCEDLDVDATWSVDV